MYLAPPLCTAVFVCVLTVCMETTGSQGVVFLVLLSRPRLTSSCTFISRVISQKKKSNCPTSFALSLSEMLLISAAYAEFLSDMFLRTVMPRLI